MKVSLNGRVVEAAIEREPGGRVRLVIGGIRLQAAAAASQTVRLREATAEEWALLRLGGFHAMWRTPVDAIPIQTTSIRKEETHGQE